MTDEPDLDIPGDLPAPDPALAAWYAAQPAPAMPDEVWARLQQALAAEPPLAAAGAVASLSAHRERRGRRLVPILAGAAGLVLVGAVVIPVLRGGEPAPVVADAPVVTQPTGGEDAGDGQPPLAMTPSATPAAPTDPSPAPSGTGSPASTAPATEVLPAAMLMSTGTEYTEADLPRQLDALLANSGYDAPEAMAALRSATVTATPTPLAGGGITNDLAALAECLRALRGSPLELPALVVDRARYQGIDSAIVIMLAAISNGSSGSPAPDDATPAPSATPGETMLDVYVVGHECTDDDIANAVRLQYRLN